MNYPKIIMRLAGGRTHLPEETTYHPYPKNLPDELKDNYTTFDKLANAHRFEFKDDVSFLLTMTDNKLTGEHKLPYPTTFLDCNFSIPGTGTNTDPICYGLLLEEVNRLAVTSIEDAEQFGIDLGEDRLGKHFIKPGYALNEVAHIDIPPTIACTAFLVAQAYYIEEVYPLMEYDGLVTMVLEALFKTGLRMKDIGNIDQEDVRYHRRSIKTFNAITANFLDLLDSHDVTIGHVPQAKPYTGKDRKPNPPRSVVRLSLPLQQYVDSMKKGGHLPYNHAFWVRGHWKHWMNERYVASGKQGTKTWVPPYVKGEGILVRKSYETHTNYSKFEG